MTDANGDQFVIVTISPENVLHTWGPYDSRGAALLAADRWKSNVDYADITFHVRRIQGLD